MIDLDEWNKAHPVGSDVVWLPKTRTCLLRLKVLLPAEICDVYGEPVVWGSLGSHALKIRLDELYGDSRSAYADW